MTTLLFVLAWLVCSFIGYGLTLGDFTHECPYMSDYRFAIGFNLIGGPIGLLTALITGNGHWRVKPLTTEERWQAFYKEYDGELDREYFEQHYN